MTETTPDIHLELNGTPQDVRDALAKLQAKLSDQVFANCPADTLEIVLAEVLNNVVEHALAKQGDGRIKVKCNHAKDRWFVQVCDNGTPMPGHKIPAGNPPEIDTPLQDLPEGGFGWAMVHSLSQDIIYLRTAAGWNKLTFIVPN